jgi:hypothetical protein
MQPARYSKLMEKLWSEAGILEGVVGESQRRDVRYWTIGQLIIFVYEEFGSVTS